jgi:hypothetical protein
MKNATAVRKPLDTIAAPIRSRYKVHEEPGDPGNGNRVSEGVDGRDLSREDARDEVDDGITFSSSFVVSPRINRIRNALAKQTVGDRHSDSD